MTDQKAMAALDVLLSGNTWTPEACREMSRLLLAGVTADTPPARDYAVGGAIPARLAQFLGEYERSPEHHAEAKAVVAATALNLGTRVFRLLLEIGSRPRETGQTDIERNRQDVRLARRLVTGLMVEVVNTPMLPRETAALLGRVADALDHVQEKQSPALFDVEPPPDGGRRPAQAEGRLAAALEIVVSGGTKLDKAKSWMDREMRHAKVLDESGNEIRAARVASWRSNFRKNLGSEDARWHYRMDLENCKALLGSPRGPAKATACQDYARRQIGLVAATANCTVSRPKN